jgi:zinc transport system substrate-binding protein
VEEYGLKYEAAFPGCSSETEPSAATLTYLVNKIKKENISVVLYLELSNHKIADVLAETCGIKTAMFHSCHNMSKEGLESGETYLSLMEKNLEVLKEALQ